MSVAPASKKTAFKGTDSRPRPFSDGAPVFVSLLLSNRPRANGEECKAEDAGREALLNGRSVVLEEDPMLPRRDPHTPESDVGRKNFRPRSVDARPPTLLPGVEEDEDPV